MTYPRAAALGHSWHHIIATYSDHNRTGTFPRGADAGGTWGGTRGTEGGGGPSFQWQRSVGRPLQTVWKSAAHMQTRTLYSGNTH